MAGAADQAAQGSQAGSASGGSRPGVAPPAARRRRALAETAAAVAVLLAVGTRAFVLQTFYIPTPSMVPTLGGSGTGSWR